MTKIPEEVECHLPLSLTPSTMLFSERNPPREAISPPPAKDRILKTSGCFSPELSESLRLLD